MKKKIYFILMVHFLQIFFVVCIVLALEKYSSLLYHGYGCLIGFFTLLFNHNFSKSVFLYLCYWYWSQCNILGCISIWVRDKIFGKVYMSFSNFSIRVIGCCGYDYIRDGCCRILCKCCGGFTTACWAWWKHVGYTEKCIKEFSERTIGWNEVWFTWQSHWIL